MRCAPLVSAASTEQSGLRQQRSEPVQTLPEGEAHAEGKDMSAVKLSGLLASFTDGIGFKPRAVHLELSPLIFINLLWGG